MSPKALRELMVGTFFIAVFAVAGLSMWSAGDQIAQLTQPFLETTEEENEVELIVEEVDTVEKASDKELEPCTCALPRCPFESSVCTGTCGTNECGQWCARENPKLCHSPPGIEEKFEEDEETEEVKEEESEELREAAPEKGEESVVCNQSECDLGGKEFCAAVFSKGCIETNDFPCLRCKGEIEVVEEEPTEEPVEDVAEEEVAEEPQVTAEETEEEVPTEETEIGEEVTDVVACKGNECELLGGGNEFCAGYGQQCTPTEEFPCFVCEGEIITEEIIVEEDIPAPEDIAQPEDPFAAELLAANTDYETPMLHRPEFQTTAFVVPDPLNCGNGILDSGEQCDDKNNRDFDGCSEFCLLEIGTCGDGIVQPLLGEQCEPSIHEESLPYGCTDECTHRLSFCGDGRNQLGEECDDGVQNSYRPNARCRPTCRFGGCGDGILDIDTEFCDDGNLLNRDGCNRVCHIEPDFYSNKPVLPGSSVEFPTDMPTPPTPSIKGRIAETGPEALFVVAIGAAAGYAIVRRRKRV